MNKLTKHITYIEVERIEELDENARELILSAKEATQGSYAPYSHFYVGAAALLDNGIIVKGANQENGAYPSGLCAERTALFAAGANYPNNKVVALAIAARQESFLDEPIVPCGACLQVMVETEQRAGHELTIYLYGEKHTYMVKGVKSFLPFAFTLK